MLRSNIWKISGGITQVSEFKCNFKRYAWPGIIVNHDKFIRGIQGDTYIKICKYKHVLNFQTMKTWINKWNLRKGRILQIYYINIVHLSMSQKGNRNFDLIRSKTYQSE